MTVPFLPVGTFSLGDAIDQHRTPAGDVNANRTEAQVEKCAWDIESSLFLPVHGCVYDPMAVLGYKGLDPALGQHSARTVTLLFEEFPFG
jgi:hypothetical protein